MSRAAALPLELAERVRARLAELSFNESHLLELTQLPSALAVNGADARSILERLASAGDVGVLARSLWFGHPLPVVDVSRALGESLFAQLVAAGVLVTSAGRVESRVIVLPWTRQLIVSDRPVPGQPEPNDHVMGVARGTEVVRSLLIRRPVERALELGTGCGPLALQMAAFATHVDAVDLNERALDYAVFNASLNGIDNCHFQAADFFALEKTLADQQYDLVICQPPFFLGPSREVVFRDAVGRGDSGLWQLVSIVNERLRPGGYGQLYLNWFQFKDLAPTDRLHQIMANLDCDVFVGQADSEDPLHYAARWLTSSDTPAELLQGKIDEHARYYSELQVEAIASGVIVLRKRADGAKPWRHFTELAEAISDNAGVHLEQIFAGQDFLQNHSDQSLLTARLAAPADLQLDQTLVRNAAGWATGACATRRSDGICYRVDHDGPTLDLVMACDGKRTLAEAVATLAERGYGSSDAITPFAVATARTMIAHGLLLPQH